MTFDVHQHLWPASLVDALRERRRPPRLRGWTLELPGELRYEVAGQDHDPNARAATAARDGVEVVVVSLSSPLGIEMLPAHEARELIAAYHEGCASLPHPFRAWAAAPAAGADPDPGTLAHELDRGFVGLQLPAPALCDRRGYERLAPLLELLSARGRPLLIHPGAASRGAAGSSRWPAPPGEDGPPWWPAVVDHVQQMHAAWFAFRAWGRARHPHLRVCFALLAGLAPLHAERVAARAHERTIVDPGVFLDVSSYGTKAIDAVIRVLGIDGLVNGSDRPYGAPVQPDLGQAALHALRCTNPARLLGLEKEVSDDRAFAALAQPVSG